MENSTNLSPNQTDDWLLEWKINQWNKQNDLYLSWDLDINDLIKKNNNLSELPLLVQKRVDDLLLKKELIERSYINILNDLIIDWDEEELISITKDFLDFSWTNFVSLKVFKDLKILETIILDNLINDDKLYLDRKWEFKDKNMEVRQNLISIISEQKNIKDLFENSIRISKYNNWSLDREFLLDFIRQSINYMTQEYLEIKEFKNFLGNYNRKWIIKVKKS